MTVVLALLAAADAAPREGMAITAVAPADQRFVVGEPLWLERARLHAGPVPIEPGVTPTGLVWDGWTCTLASGAVWP